MHKSRYEVFSLLKFYFSLKASYLSFSKKCSKVLATTQQTPQRGNACTASASAMCCGSIALPSKEIMPWRGQSNRSLNHIVSQLKAPCKLLRAMQNNCNHFVKRRKILLVPENLWQVTVHKPLTHTLHKGYTCGYWCFYAESVAYSNTEAYRVLDDYTVPLEILS